MEYTYSPLECAHAMLLAGFPVREIPTGIAIMTAESRRRYDATLDTAVERSVGPWQINLKAHGSLISEYNARMLLTATAYAYKLYRDAAGWHDWSTYTNGDYRAYLSLGKSLLVFNPEGYPVGLFRLDWNEDIIGSVSSDLAFYDIDGQPIPDGKPTIA